MRVISFQTWSTGAISWTVDRDCTLRGCVTNCPAILTAEAGQTYNGFAKNPQDGAAEEFTLLLGAANYISGDFNGIQTLNNLNFPLLAGTRLLVASDNSFGSGIVQLFLED